MTIYNRIKKASFISLLIVIAVTFITGCDSINRNKITEGEIIYSIQYPHLENKMMLGLMPSEMTMHFKENKVRSDFSASMGMFSMSLIPDLEKKTLGQYIKVLSDKKCIVFKQAEIKKLVLEQPKLKIELTNETKVIAGYKCKKASVSYDALNKPGFDIYFTNEISIKNPNWYSIYKDIEGVIMEYEITQYNIEMKFTATAVNKIEIDSKSLEPPKDYREVSKEEINSIFETFN